MRKVMKSYGILKAEKSMYPAVVMQTTTLSFSSVIKVITVTGI